MTFFCFLDSEHLPMAHVEPLEAETLEDARHQASRLLKHHQSARAARVYRDTVEIAILQGETRRP